MLTPPEKSLAVAAMQALDACEPVEFSEGNTTRKESVLDWFKRRLQVAAPVVQFGEHAPGSAGATVAIDAKTATDEAFDRAVRAHRRCLWRLRSIPARTSRPMAQQSPGQMVWMRKTTRSCAPPLAMRLA